MSADMSLSFLKRRLLQGASTLVLSLGILSMGASVASASDLAGNDGGRGSASGYGGGGNGYAGGGGVSGQYSNFRPSVNGVGGTAPDVTDTGHGNAVYKGGKGGGVGATSVGTSAVTINGHAGGAGGAAASMWGGPGGGGGGAGLFLNNGDFNLASGSVITGGIGGEGGAGGYQNGGGGGGGGGAGALLRGATLTNSEGSKIVGGKGGASANGGRYSRRSGSGGGGDGVVVDQGATFTNLGSVTGGVAGQMMTTPGEGTAATVGSAGSGLRIGSNSHVINAGTIAAGDSKVAAVVIQGNDNTFEIWNTSKITGNVVVVSGHTGNTLALGGDADGTLAGSAIGTSYQGFQSYSKIGASTWTLNGALKSPALNWTIDNGTLAFSNSANTTYTGTFSGTGTLAQTGTGIFTLDSDSSGFAGTTRVDAGTFLVNNKLGGTIKVGADGQLGGKGSIEGDTVLASGSTLLGRSGQTLTFNNDLALQNGNTVEATLGQPSSTALFDVKGDLQLAGTLNVIDGGGFGAGIYRLFDVSGTTTGTMVIGDQPPGAELEIVKDIPHQVNLVNSSGVTINMWDGSNVQNENDGIVEGGDGVWNYATSANWTGMNGAENRTWQDGPLFAVFAGRQSGTVIIDNSAGDVSAAGLQFQTDGYKLDGDALTLLNNIPGGTTPIIRVDDGVTATIASELHGTQGLHKRDFGTLVLTGANSYSGSTTVREGVLQLGDGGKSGSVTGDIVLSRSDHGFGALALNRSDDVDFSNVISGEGSLYQIGSGTTKLLGANTYTGDTTVQNGTLLQGAAGAFSASSSYRVGSAGTLDFGGNNTTVASIDNGGTVRLGAQAGTVVSVAGNYIGEGGTLVLNTVLNGDASATDLLKVEGDTQGTTNLRVINRGGSGAQTVEGIRVVEVAGHSAGTFSLLGDYTTKDGEQAVVAGAYAYTLQQGASDLSNSDWYLRSAYTQDGLLLNAGVPVYEGYVANMQALNKLPTLQERVGERYFSNKANSGSSSEFVNEPAIWARIEGAHNRLEPNTSASRLKQDINTFIMQAGVDGQFYEDEAGRLIAGITGQYGHAKGDTSSAHGDGSISTDAWSLGANATWYGNSGVYVDTQAQVSWFDSGLDSDTANVTLGDGLKATGYALSIEAGQRFALNQNWSLTPQAQLSWSKINADGFRDVWDNHIGMDDGNSLIGRLGLAANYANSWVGADGRSVKTSVYGIANIYQEFLDGSNAISVAAVNFDTDHDKTWAGIGAGGTYAWADNKYAFFGEGSVNTSLNHFSDSYAVKGTLGFKVKW
ncbi:autotransporter outer membrane beta-barrel domain-containing protein [Brucellaceae bacterium D45D]